MKNDKVILIFMIVNIIAFCFLMAFLSDKKEEKTKEENKPIVVEKKTKNCNLTFDTDEGKVTNINNIIINYSKDDIITNYSITYNLSYMSSTEPEGFKTYKNDYDNLITRYQSTENVKVKNYSYVDNTYTFTIDYTLIPDDENELILSYNQNINDAINSLTNQGYTCY